MNKYKVYIDTSVIGGCFDEEFKLYSNKLFESFEKQIYIPIISEIVLEELEKAPDKVKAKLKSLESLQIYEITDEIRILANQYLIERIITQNFSDDAIHIACSTVYKIDVLVSWNFKHIVNFNKIKLFNSINLKEGYSHLEIRTPMELFNE